MKMIHLPIWEHGNISVRKYNEKNKKYCIVMAPITKAQEEVLDGKGTIKLKFSDYETLINRSYIYCYGEIDFDNEEDLELIEKFKFFDDNKPTYVPSRYNYHTHSAGTNDKGYIMYTETLDNIRAARFIHRAIGKPNRIVIFKTKI